MCHSLKLVSGDIQGAMKNAKDIDVSVVPDEIHNPVVAVQQDSNVALRHAISAASLGILHQRLSKVINPFDCLGCGAWVISRNILVDVR